MKNLLLLTCILWFVSCNYNENSKTISQFEKTFSMVGEEILENELDAIMLYSLDSFLIIKTRGKLGNFFSVYRSPELIKIGEFAKVGEGPKEFKASRIGGSFLRKDRIVLLPIIDPIKHVIHYLDFNHFVATGDENYVDIISSNYSTGLTQEIFHISDSILVSTPGIDRIDFGRLLFYDVVNDSSYVNELFPIVKDEELSSQDKYALYFSRLTVNHGKRVIASAMDAFNRIDLFDFSGNLIRSIETGDSDHLISAASLNDDLGLIPYNSQYMWINSTNSFIFALHFNQDYREINKVKINPKIRVFNWDGDPISELLFEDYIMGFAIDEINCVLYGIDNYSNRTLKYDLSVILPELEID